MPHQKQSDVLTNRPPAAVTNPSLDEDALKRCDSARDHALCGNFEAARSAMGELWQRVGHRPNLDGLGLRARAEVLLRSGALTGWIGSARQIEGAQELAKDMLTESLSLFSELGETEKQAEVHVDLGICYWRTGAIEEADAMLSTALGLVRGGIQRGRALMNLAVLDLGRSKLTEALQSLREAAKIFDACGAKELKARNHLQLALVYNKFFALERREEYLDLAIVEATEASYHFEQTGNKRDEAIVLNNLAWLYMRVGRYNEAHNDLGRARRLFESLNDQVNIARVDDSRARLLLAERRYREADVAARTAVKALEQGEESAVLAEALTTCGVVRARQRDFDGARLSLERAAEIAERAGDMNGAGLACLTIIEELSDLLSPGELIVAYKQADAYLERNFEQDIVTRLRRCARLVLQSLRYIEASFECPAGEALNLKEQTERFVRRFEAMAIRRALVESGGGITEAARRLGITHQTLSYKLDKQNGELDDSRKPKRIRRRSIIKNRPGN